MRDSPTARGIYQRGDDMNCGNLVMASGEHVHCGKAPKFKSLRKYYTIPCSLAGAAEAIGLLLHGKTP